MTIVVKTLLLVKLFGEARRLRPSACAWSQAPLSCSLSLCQRQASANLHPLAVAIINLVMFTTLFVAYFLTSCYFKPVLNRASMAMYLCLLFGAVCRLASTCVYGTASATSIDLGYWCALSFVLALGLVLNFPILDVLRNKIDEELIMRLSFFGTSSSARVA